MHPYNPISWLWRFCLFFSHFLTSSRRIFANLWWMSADILIYEYPDSPSYYYERAAVASDMMAAGLCWLLFFYFIVKPYTLFDCENIKALELYNNTGLPARWPIFFDSWRAYENLQYVTYLLTYSSDLIFLFASRLHTFFYFYFSSFSNCHSALWLFIRHSMFCCWEWSLTSEQ